MPNRYWIASSSGNWDDTANWSDSSGGSGGSSVPTSADNVFFDANGAGDCSGNNQHMSANSWDLTGYTGTITISAYRYLNLYGGTFTPGSTATIAGAANNSGIKASSGNEEIDLGTGIIDSSVLKIEATSGSSGTLFKGSAPSCIMYLKNYAGGRTIELSGNLTIDGLDDIVTTSGLTFVTNNYDLTLSGDVSLTANTSWSAGTGTITFSGAVAQSINFNGEAVDSIDIDKTSGIVTLAGDVDPDSLLISAGVLDINNHLMNVAGNVTLAAGTTLQDTV